MKKFTKTSLIAGTLFLTSIACQKSGSGKLDREMSQDYAVSVADSVSSAASQEIPGKKFVRTADVNMEVKDVYESTIAVEKNLRELGGFVTASRLHSNVSSEKTFETSDTEATLIKKYQTENNMQVRVPTQKLAEFLTFINNHKVFLNARIILAEDVTANARIAEMEIEKLKKTGEVISQMKNNTSKVEKTEENMEQKNNQEISDIALADNLKYSTVDIYMKEPQIRVAEIAVTNSKNMDNRYKFNFLYDLKNAFAEGFYLIQQIITGLIRIWPILLIFGVIYYFVKRKKLQLPKNEIETEN